MKYTVTKSYVSVIGTIWMPAITCAMEYDLSDYDIRNIEQAKRELGLDWRGAIENWLSTNSGDFQSVDDFRADIETSEGNIVIEWASGDAEMTYNDCMFGEETNNMVKRLPNMEFEILWYSGGTYWAPNRVIGRDTVRRRDLGAAITAACNMLKRGKGNSDYAHGFYVRVKKEEA